ncbi:MAG: hypothetical protein HOL80_03530 [Candidatus Magasanikbacteria bacterium]|nr:hypothetical protein [Candidatus Magasanikbacteria bacterium]MBT5820670.1 hypothetical protein [Candidatus Magasanikbacteria bacterium]MBT6294320.1 hypothetical protein [Candidatus Magasanikbacteria bacterium]
MSRKSRRAKTRRAKQRLESSGGSRPTLAGQLVANKRPKNGNIIWILIEEEYGFGFHVVIFVGSQSTGTYTEQRRAVIEELESLFRYGCFPGLQYWFYQDRTAKMQRLEQFSGQSITRKEYEKMSADMMYATAHVHDPDDSYLVLPKIYGGGKVVRIDKARQEETEELHALGQPSYIDVYCTEDQVVPEPKLLSAP